MPLPYGWASESTVIQSPDSRAARRRSCQVRSVSTVERPLEETEGEPAGFQLRLAEEPVGDEQERRRTVSAGGVPEAARDGREERPADAVDGADAGCDPLLAGEVLRVGQRAKARREGRGECVWVVGELGECRAERLGRLAMGGHERDGSLRDLAAGRAVDHDASPGGSLGR